MKDEKELILNAYKALASFIVYGAKGQPPRWPFSIIETNWYYTHFFPREIYRTITALERKGISKEKIAKLCWGPSAVTHWLYIIEPTMGDPTLDPFKGLSREEGIDFIKKTVEILSCQRKGDVFCRDGKNILLSKEEVDKLIEDKEFVNARENPQVMKSLSNLTTTLWHYTILIQVGHRAYSQEFHGLYPIEGNKSLFVKDFFNLAPGRDVGNPIWDFSLKMPYEEITVLEIYENVEKYQIDMFNHYDIKGRPIKFCVVCGNSVLSEKEIKDLAKVCIDILSEANREIRKFSRPDWVKKIIDLRYLWLKPHKDLLGIDWHPPKDIYYLTTKTEEAARAAEQFEKNIISIIKGLSPAEIIEKVTQIFMEKIYGR
jgi:hypothetical protein